MTTQKDIDGWVKEAGNNTSHVLIVCDTFSHEDYPVYVKKTENLEEVKSRYNGANMQRIMEVIELNKKFPTFSKIDPKLEMELRNELMEELARVNRKIEALNNPISFRVEISSHWSTEGEENGIGNGKTIREAVENAETDYSTKNKRWICDVQGSYYVYLIGKNGDSVMMPNENEKIVKKFKGKHNPSRLKDRYSFKSVASKI
jgi:hypothetical protein